MRLFIDTFAKILGFLTAIVVCIFLIVFFLSFINRSDQDSNFIYFDGDKKSDNKIAVIKLIGPIVSEPLNFYNIRGLGNIKAIYPSLIKEYLNELTKKNVKGLIISINSPGGSVSATNTIYNLFKKFKIQNKMPLYFHSTDMLASGAYWISLSGNKIFANYGTLIGSIGVKGPDWIYYNTPTSLSSGFLGKSVESQNGIKLFSNIAGKSKDILNPFRSPSENEILQLQNMVNDIYNDFVNLVSINRKLEKNIIINDIGAMIYDSKKAKENYLIDGIKNLNEIITIMVDELNLKDNQIIINGKKNNFNLKNLNIKVHSSKIVYFENLINSKFCDNIKNQLSVAVINNFNVNC